VPTSLESAWRCEELGLEVLHPNFRGELAWGFDGADEVDDRLWLIKGKGGALLREKILAVRCKHFIVIVDESKLVSQLGRTCPIPVELIPEAISIVEGELKARGATDVMLRPAGEGKHGPVITEMGNVIVDALFPQIDHALETDIKSIVGVVESGLFIDYADEVLIAGKDGVTSRKAK
jgi:ribose 5-phosphate isomerase A